MVKNILLACVLTAAGGYLLGSILFGVLISKVMYNDDVRNHGSGNAGMTNGLRTYGKLPAVFTTIGDVGKSVAAVNLGRFIFDALLSGTGAAWQNPLDPVCGAYLAAIFCMIGHSRPIFFGFKGGKGVLVGAGAALATEPLVCAVLLVVFLIEVAITHIVSLGSSRTAQACRRLCSARFVAALWPLWLSGCTAPTLSGCATAPNTVSDRRSNLSNSTA